MAIGIDDSARYQKKIAKKAAPKKQYIVSSDDYGGFWDEIFPSIEAAKKAAEKGGDFGEGLTIFEITKVTTGKATSAFTWKA